MESVPNQDVLELAEGTAVLEKAGFLGTAVEVDSAEPEYGIHTRVTGFAPSRDCVQGVAVDVNFSKLQSLAYTVGKRSFDVLFSIAAISVLSPLMALIALAIRLTSRGPVFFRQDRVGPKGIFKMLKFRSMYLNDCSDTHHTKVGDPRITPVGAILRRSSFDELPQLLNVLCGDMSIVGPRPELVKFVERFKSEIPNYMARHRGKGGITGWAQINGFRGSETSIPVRIQYDLEYLRNWSFWLDLKIILLTVYKGLFTNAF